jgi:sulfite reductase alpha subunit-like flavoprotein
LSLETSIGHLTTVYDITSTPAQVVLGRMTPHIHDQRERSQCEVLATDEVAYTEWKQNYMGGVLELWTVFPSLKLDLAQMCQMLELLKPRWYSLASVPEGDGLNTFDLVLTAIEFSNANGQLKKGLCSNYLKELELGSSITFVHK